MNKTWIGLIAATVCLTAMSAQAVTINLSAGVVRDQNGAPMTDGGLMILQSAGPNGTFGNVTDTTFSDDADDILIPADPYAGTFVMDSATTFNPPNSGIHLQAIQFNLGNVGLAANQKLRLLWFPGLGLSATSPGPGQHYGMYTDAVGIDGSSPWVVPASNSATVDFNFSTIANGGSVAESAAEASNQTAGSSNNPPSAICQNVTVNANVNCQANVTAAQVNNGSSDADGIITNLSLSNPGPFTPGTPTLVTLTVTDDDGATATCTASITVLDQTPPTIVCPNDINVTIPANQPSTTVNFTVPSGDDNCNVNSVVCNPASGSLFLVGTTTVTCTATDGANNTGTCLFDVIVSQESVENQPPVARCRTTVEVAADNDCQANVTPNQVDNGSSDPDGIIASLSLLPAGPYALGNTVVTLTVTDNNGATATCTATITVSDLTAPSIFCDGDISRTVTGDDTGLNVEFPPAQLTVSDQCDAQPAVVCVPASGSFFTIGSTSVTCTATDAADNSASCSFNVIVTKVNEDIDADNDGYPVSVDCDDNNAAINPGATETCNGIDDDCDGQVDEGLTSTFYADADGDGFGNPSGSRQACTAPTGFVGNDDDCNDANAAVNPGATESCNGIDDNCDGEVDESGANQQTWYLDADGDGFGTASVSQVACARPNGYASNDDDCNDANAAIKPGATEVCDGVDNDCDGQADEGVTTTFYRDADGDGYGNASATVQACSAPAGYVGNDDDCNDANPAVSPVAPEIPGNGIDDNCNGQVDEGDTGGDCSLSKLMALVRNLEGLNEGQINSLLVKLRESNKSYEAGRYKTACNQFNAYLNELRAMLKTGRLDRESEATRDVLRCSRAVGSELCGEPIEINYRRINSGKP